jgi:hypothetical protein
MLRCISGCSLAICDASRLRRGAALRGYQALADLTGDFGVQSGYLGAFIALAHRLIATHAD